MIFRDLNEAVLAWQNGYVHLHSRIGVQTNFRPDKPFTDWQKERILITTVGKIIFNEIMPRSSLT